MTAIEKVEPDWAMEDQSILIDLHYAFGIDALETSRPMNYPVYTTEDMDTVFDGISYEKGFISSYTLSFNLKL